MYEKLTVYGTGTKACVQSRSALRKDKSYCNQGDR